ncbi:MAG TPA: hypothetical protein VFU29_01975 [Chitinophagaceae bacterium]|nr:hypothetical protein [Chitinophagaceae bacterium]
MDTYLLLRSNKQSGPYSLQQLVSSGLKPYDLVWVEGKSAAWRYPSEVDGLKDYAPATEEQPYDRFYKKPEEKPQEKQVVKQMQPQEETYVLPKEETYTLPVENRTVTTSKKVFVAMPENHVPKKQSQPVYAKAPAIIEEKPVVVEEKKIENKPAYLRQEILVKEPVVPKQERVINTTPIPINEEPTLNEKYSESLDDIKRRYTETYLTRKKKSRWTSTHTSILQVVGGAVIFCFLVVVAYKNFAGEDQPQSKTTMIQPDKRSISTTTPSNTSAVIPPIVPETKMSSTKKVQTKKEDTNIPAESLVTNSIQQKKDDMIKESEIASVEKKAIMPKATEEKTEETKPKTRPVNINKLVNVRANNYKQRAFGGIMNLELTVNNDSKFELDKVIVELEYLKPSEQPIKTEKIIFSSIEPNGSKTLKIPDYLRGVKVTYRVMEIESSQYERQTAGL